MTRITCDQCGEEIKDPTETILAYHNRRLTLRGLIGGSSDFERDFCDEDCLRDFLNPDRPAYTAQVQPLLTGHEAIDQA